MSTIVLARNILFSKSGLLAHSSMYFKGIILDTPRPQKCLVLTTEPKPWYNAVVIPLLNNYQLFHASPAIEYEILLVNATVAVTGWPLNESDPFDDP